MRKKTPKQINEQTMRILHRIAQQEGQWKGRVYLGLTKKGAARALRARGICWRYIDNIYAVNGIKDRHKTNDTTKCNWIWENAATPVSIYAKNV